MHTDYLHILKKYWGYDAFRPLQQEAIESAGAGYDTLVLMPTGGGKSVVYQVPALAVEGICVVITPLISLMKDQVDRLHRHRIPAEAIHSGVKPRDVDRMLDNCVYGDVKFLYIAPERIDSEMFRMRFRKMRVALIAVDEAHCISQWGYDFRPSYLKIVRLRELQPDVPVLALTASATPELAGNITRQLQFRNPRILRMSFARKNLSYLVRRTEDKHEHLLRVLNNVPGTAIVYVRTREKTEVIAGFLKEQGIGADSYHGGMGHLSRTQKQEAWTAGRTRVIVATNAFGMGIDKADVRCVIHYDLPDSLENYYQEAGRAGRDEHPSFAVLLLSQEDKGKAAKRLSFEFPSVETIRNIYEGLFNYLQIAIGDGKSQVFSINPYELCARMKLFPATFISALKILRLNGYLELTEEVDSPPRVRFIVPRDELYRMRVERRELDTLVTVLLRQYSGLFSEFRPIDEDELAHLSGYTAGHVREVLKKLWQLHIIKYIPGGRSPLLVLNEERLPTADLRISPESYTLRRESAERRLEAMLHYTANDSECRSVLIGRYFGEADSAPCGKCDVCRERKKRTAEPEDAPHPIDARILAALAGEPMEIKALCSVVSGEIGEVLERITALLDEDKISEGESGKLRINR